METHKNPVSAASRPLEQSLSEDAAYQNVANLFPESEVPRGGGALNSLTDVAKSSMDGVTAKARRKKNFQDGMLQSTDVQTGRIFNEDSQSRSLYSTITSEKVKTRVTDLLKDMHQHAESQQHTMTDEMDYQDILGQGIMYEGEHLVEGLEPMRLLTLDMVKAEDAGFSSNSVSEESSDTRFGIRLYLTNQRLIVVDAEPDRGSKMRKMENDSKLDKQVYKLSYEIESELWYYPIPLADVKGLCLDVRTVTKSQVALKVMRPWWSIILGAIGIGLVVYGTLRAFKIIDEDPTLGYEIAGIGYALIIVMAIMFANYNYLVQGAFEPWQLQERQLRLGITDPISQTPSILYCNMAKDYTFADATVFVHNLQMNTPQLHYGSLTNTFMQSKVNSPYDRTFLVSDEEKKEDKDGSPVRGSDEADEIDVKLVIESPVNRIVRLTLDTNMTLRKATEACTTFAAKCGVLPKSTIIRLAIIDVEGDKCLIKDTEELCTFLQEGSKYGVVKIFAWPEFTSMPPPLA